MTAPIKFAVCHPDRENFFFGKCEECYRWTKDPDAPCPHTDRKKDKFGRCTSCMSRYYSLRRDMGIGDKFGTVRSSAAFRNIQDRKERRAFTKKHARLRKYGISVEAYNEMLLRQGGVCAICNQPPTGNRTLTVDHDHSCCNTRNKCCGKCVRGLLCHGCNMRLGQIESDLVQRSLQYLRTYKGMDVQV